MSNVYITETDRLYLLFTLVTYIGCAQPKPVRTEFNKMLMLKIFLLIVDIEQFQWNWSNQKCVACAFHHYLLFLWNWNQWTERKNANLFDKNEKKRKKECSSRCHPQKWGAITLNYYELSFWMWIESYRYMEWRHRSCSTNIQQVVWIRCSVIQNVNYLLLQVTLQSHRDIPIIGYNILCTDTCKRSFEEFQLQCDYQNCWFIWYRNSIVMRNQLFQFELN